MNNKPTVMHYSDVLCVWAYVSDIRLVQLMTKYADSVHFELRYCSVFPDTLGKITTAWADRGGFAGYGAHVRSVADEFDHVKVSQSTWDVTQPRSSTAVHTVLKAAELIDKAADPKSEIHPTERAAYRLGWALRLAFFENARDLATWEVQRDCANALGLDTATLEDHLRSGAAIAALDEDIVLAKKIGIVGSPTFHMNGGRQILYGNVGYKLLEANIEELLRARNPEDASWC